jgi:FKBP-type peptidyl-prolyl cis-trans isomerase 2
LDLPLPFTASFMRMPSLPQLVQLQVTEEGIKLDANNIGAGKTLLFELELVDIQRADE